MASRSSKEETLSGEGTIFWQMKKFIVFAVLGIIAISAWLIYSKVTQARQDAAYQKTLSQFQRDLPTGTSRAAVKKYLDSRKIEYHLVGHGGDEADSYEMEIGKEPGGLFCEPWIVIVSLEFNSADTLRNVQILKLGAC